MDSRIEPIRPFIEASLEWLPQHPSYQTWIIQRSGMLGVRGKPAADKTTNLRSIISSCQVDSKMSTSDDRLCLFFFFKLHGEYLSKSRIGMFRTLLHQLLQAVPIAGHQFWHWAEEEATNARPQDGVMDFDYLQSWFLSALITASCFHRIIIAVDALDESCDSEHNLYTDVAREVIADLRHINRTMDSIGNAHVRICFSSRYFPAISVDNGLEIHEGPEGTIQRYLDL